MAIDKALYQAPMGLDQMLAQQGEQPDLEIEIEDPEAVNIHLDGVDIEIEKAKDENKFNINLAEDMDEQELMSIASELISDFEDDCTARKDWIQTYVDGLELLGMKIEERSEPWEGACGVYHPLLSEALVKFQAETMMSMFPAAGPVKTQIIGKETQAKKEAATRVSDDMNYQLTDKMKEYRPEHERMLWGLGLSGNAFKKVYYDPHMRRQVSIFIPAEDMVVPYGATDLESAGRVTHVMRKTENEVLRLQAAGFYRDVDLGEPANVLDEVEKKIAEKMGFRASSDDRFKLLEMHVDLILDSDEYDDGLARPYVVTVEKNTSIILSIRRNWEPDDETFLKRQHFVHYGYVPGFGFYYFGLIHLIGAFAKSGTSLIRQLVDAGTLSNLPGGFKTRGLRVKGDDTPIAPGEFRDVDVPSGTIRDNLMALPYKEPSQVLIGLLTMIVEDGRRFANTADLQISDMSGQAPVGTTLAILERTLKVMSAVQARIHYSMKQELGLLKKIIAAYAPEDYDYEPEEGSRQARKADYDMVEVIPVSDPNASTMAQKIVQYQAVMQLAQQTPQIYNMPLLHRQMLDVLGIKNAAKLIPMDEDHVITDPVSENQNLLMMKPVKAFLTQDHPSHIAVHMAAMQDPKMQKLMQGNPLAQQIQSAAMAHINEHMGFEYRRQIEQQLGMALPPQKDESGDDVPMDPRVEAQLAPMLAQAAQKLLQQNQSEAAQQQAKQQQQDPIIQMQQQELALKGQEQQRKAAKDQSDASFKAQQIELDKARIAADLAKSKASQQLDGIKTAAQLAADKRKHMIDTGVGVLNNISNRNHEKNKQQGSQNHQAKQQSDNLGHQVGQKVLDQLHQKEMAQQTAQQAVEQLKPTKGE